MRFPTDVLITGRTYCFNDFIIDAKYVLFKEELFSSSKPVI